MRAWVPVWVLAMLAALLPGAQGRAAPTVDTRPNIVLIMADDLDERLGTIGYMPALKRLLVEQGTALDDFFVTQPICCPSRVTILRGQYAHNHRVYWNTAPTGSFTKMANLGLEASTAATWLQAAGYRTGLIGKYLNGHPLPSDPMHIPAGWDEWVSPNGGNFNNGYNYRLNVNGESVEYGTGAENYGTDVLARYATDFIRRLTPQRQPFFLHLTPIAPHSPAIPAPRHFAAGRKASLPQAPSLNEEDVSDKPAYIQSLPLLSEAALAQGEQYYQRRVATMLAVDELLEDVADALIDTGELENTYIIFTSDNGYHIGQHRLAKGKATLYEEDVAVPFIVRGPGVPANRVVEGYVASNVDLAATFAEIAGADTPGFVDGRSLLPLFGETLPPLRAWRRGLLLELTGTKSNTQQAGIRTTRYKYVHWLATDEEEFYDLKFDPYELENCVGEIKPELHEYLQGWLADLQACAGAECREVEARSIYPPQPGAADPAATAMTTTFLPIAGDLALPLCGGVVSAKK